MGTSFARKIADSFLHIVTPRRRDRYLVERREDGWDGDDGAPADDRWRRYDAGLHWYAAVDADDARRLGYWPGQERRPDFVRAWKKEQGDEALERPWTYRWDRLPKRSAGPGFTREDYRTARVRGREVARATLGEALWSQLEEDGYLDLPSKRVPGVTYRLRVGRRIEVLAAPGVETPWYYDYLCINPAYPLPEYEFFAHLYLYVRDQEEEVLRVAAPQPWDQALGRTF